MVENPLHVHGIVGHAIENAVVTMHLATCVRAEVGTLRACQRMLAKHVKNGFEAVYISIGGIISELLGTVVEDVSEVGERRSAQFQSSHAAIGARQSSG